MKNWLNKNRQEIFRWGGTILAVILIIALINDEGWDELLVVAQRIPAWRLGLAFGLIMLSRFSITGRWLVLLRSAGIPIRIRDTTSLTFTGLFASNFLPTTIGGDVVRLAGAMQMGYDRAVCLASIAADRLIGMAGMSMAAPLGIWQLFQAPVAFSAFLGGVWQRGLDFIRSTLQSFSLWFKKPLSLLGALGFTWGHMLCTFAAIQVIIDGSSTHEHMDLWMIAGLWSLSYFVTLVPISINGYGVQELSLTLLFSHVGGISEPISLMAAVLFRLLTIVASLPGAYFLPGVMAQMAAKDEDDAE